MTVVVIEPPTVLVVSVEEAKDHLSVDFDDDDVLIEALIKAVTAHLDGPDGWLGRALSPQTLELRIDEFPRCDIRLPYPPLIGIVSVKYDDADGVERTVAPSVYRTVGPASGPRLALAYGETWPTPRWQSECVRIRYTSGYNGDDGVPAPIKHAILLVMGHLYENREAINIGNIVSEIPMTAQALLSTYRVFL